MRGRGEGGDSVFYPNPVRHFLEAVEGSSERGAPRARVPRERATNAVCTHLRILKVVEPCVGGVRGEVTHEKGLFGLEVERQLDDS